jgi:SdpC family antimicrobial peptide
MGIVRKRWRRLVVVVVTVAMVSGMALHRGVASASVVPRLTSVQIADGLFFNDGRAAPYLSALQRDTIHWTDELRSIQAGIDGALQADTTGYYRSEFPARMQSGDPRRVQQALVRLGSTVRSYLEQRYGATKLDDALRLISPSAAAVPSAQPQDLMSPVVTTDVAVALIFVVVIVVVFAAPTPDVSGNQRLATEQLVGQVAAGLRLDG